MKIISREYVYNNETICVERVDEDNKTLTDSEVAAILSQGVPVSVVYQKATCQDAFVENTITDMKKITYAVLTGTKKNTYVKNEHKKYRVGQKLLVYSIPGTLESFEMTSLPQLDAFESFINGK